MFDPQMLMSMLGGMNNMGQNPSGDNVNNGDMFSSMMQNPAMLSGLMQMMNNNQQNNQNTNQTNQTGKNTYINNKASSQDVNRDLYNILKNADNI